MKRENIISEKIIAGLRVFSLFLILFVFCLPIYSQYSWYPIPNGMYNSAPYYDLCFINANTGWLIHAYGMIYKTTNGGYNYTMTDSIGIGGFNDVVFINESTGWIASGSNNLFKTTNGGANLIRITNLPDPVPWGLQSIRSLNSNFLYGCGDESDHPTIIKSTDGGNTWVSQTLSQYAAGLMDFYMLDPNTGVAGGEKLVVASTYSLVVRTTDGGNSWAVVFQGSRVNESVEKFWFVNSTTGYASLERITYPEKFVLKTTNAGLNWTELPYPNYHEHGIGFINENTGWIGGHFNPTFETTNGGLNWFNANIGQFVYGFQFFGDTLGYACGQYIYKYSETNGITQTSSETPGRFELFQNCPNPFNSLTSIGYTIRTGSKVMLKVYNSKGNEVTKLLEQYQQPGSYRYNFDASHLGSGVYFYVLSAGNFSDAKKFVLIK